jgi:hypothetical protein
MPGRFDSFEEAIKHANDAYAAAISTLTKAVQDVPPETPASNREPAIDNLVRIARMNKDALIAAIEQGFQFWEHQVRRISAGGAEASASRSPEPPSSSSSPGATTPNPMETWAENWRKATDSFVPAGTNEDLRRQAEAVQQAFAQVFARGSVFGSRRGVEIRTQKGPLHL